MKRRVSGVKCVVCIGNEGYRASLMVRRIYKSVSDPEAGARGLLRVIDESGEDYLYPEDLFAPINLSMSIGKALSLAN